MDSSGFSGYFAGMLWIADEGEISDAYQADARMMQQAQGRWVSPDPAGIGAVDMTNPQSWNRYAYVLNNPLSFVDPSGRSCVPVTSAGGGEGYGDDGDGQGCEAAGVPPGAYDPTQPATTISETVYAVIGADASDFLSYNLYLWQTSINASDAQFSVNVTGRAPSNGTQQKIVAAAKWIG